MANFVILSVFLTILNFKLSQASQTDCILDIRSSSHKNNNSNSCENGNNWGGFIGDSCEEAFDLYLYALAERANKTGKIFLNSTEQKDCLFSMEGVNKDVLFCGIEKLTIGTSECSEYNSTDVEEKLGFGLESLGKGCKSLGSGRGCIGCLERWKMISLEKGEDDNCRFAILVKLTSSKIENMDWVQKLYTCLGKESVEMDSSSIRVRKKSSLRKIERWVLYGGLLGIAVIVLIAAWVMFKTRIRERFFRTKASNNSISDQSRSLEITIKQVYLATNNLDPMNFIGQGIAGMVYRGILSNGEQVAIKHIIKDGQEQTFLREVTSLSHIKHPNLVTLLGYCEARDECFLVYELCHNGSLSEWLFGKDKTLSWIQRLKIAVECAKGLEFLHNFQEGCIVHRDIKPGNILINAKFQAKLSDFGLSKVMAMNQSFVSSEVRGTFGYVDPEYRRNHHVNSSGDVYSFGIVLLQLLSGKRVINLNVKKPMLLHKMALSHAVGGDITEFSDPKLDGEYSIKAFDMVLKLALSCTGVKQKRPSMEQVVLTLERAFDIST